MLGAAFGMFNLIGEMDAPGPSSPASTRARSAAGLSWESLASACQDSARRRKATTWSAISRAVSPIRSSDHGRSTAASKWSTVRRRTGSASAKRSGVPRTCSVTWFQVGIVSSSYQLADT
jgi:hypothetical protein